jgi:hypothetical protein
MIKDYQTVTFENCQEEGGADEQVERGELQASLTLRPCVTLVVHAHARTYAHTLWHTHTHTHTHTYTHAHTHTHIRTRERTHTMTDSAELHAISEYK